MDNWKPKWCHINLLLLLFSINAAAQQKDDLVPDAVIVQHAGSIGYLSAGVGYELFTKKRGSLDLCYGHVPENMGGTLHVATAKFAYRPFEVRVSDKLTFYPANPGVFLAYTFGKNLSFAFDNKQYSRGYYGWSEALRSHLSVSSEVELHTVGSMIGKGVKAVAVYSEFNVSDLYLVSWATNRDGLPLFDVFKLGIGVRLKF